MKKVIIIMLLCATWVSTAQEKITREITSFTELRVFDKVHVTLISSTENKVEITGFQKEEVDVVQENSILKLKMSLDNVWEKDNTKIILYASDVVTIDANEGAKVIIEGTLEANKLDVRAQEGANIIGEVKAEHIFAKAVTGGKVKLSGSVTTQEVVIKAGGHYPSKDLMSETTKVKISAGGGAHVSASDYVKANTAAGGIIRIYGNPKEIDQKKIFGGKIIVVN